MDGEDFLRKRVKWQAKPRAYRTEKLADTVQRLMNNQISPACSKLRPVVDLWKQLLPADFQEHCKIVGITGRVLQVAVDWPSYAHELRLCSEELVRQIQQNCPASRIEKIKVVISNGK